MTTSVQDIAPPPPQPTLVKPPAAPIPIDHFRAEQRFAVNQKVTVTLIGAECRFTGLVRNVSRKGMRLEVQGCILNTSSAVKVEWDKHVVLANIRHRNQRGDSTILGLELFSSWESFLEEILAQHADHLEQSHRELQSFTYLAAHEIQETLSVVLLYMDLLARSVEASASPDTLRLIRCAQSGATRIRELTHDLSTYRRVVSESIQITPVNCHRLVSAAASIFAAQTDAAVTHDRLPILMGDGRELRLVFQSLISNGLKFNRSQKREVHVSARHKGGEWIFSVKDNGIGIDPEKVAGLFQPFARLHNDAEYPGSGLGLALSRSIVEKHGGKMWVESAPAKGSTFFFTVPASSKPWE